MKFASTILAVTTAIFVPATPVLTQDPTDCTKSNKTLNGADFVLTELQAYNLNTLSSYFSSNGKKVTVAQVFEDANHKMTEDGLGHRIWERTPDFDDLTTKKWFPQGLTTTADALDTGIYEGKDGFVVSWYRDDDGAAGAVRVTFVNKVDNTYRHLLLVEPDGTDNFKNVPCHAGGIIWYGATLWVLDSAKSSIRVFDMSNIWQVGSGDGVGGTPSGGYSAANYKYVIPQLRSYKWTSDFPFRFSFMGLDRTSTPDSILVGEYQKNSDDVPVRMVQWNINATDRRLRDLDSQGRAKGIWAYCVNIDRMQGAVQAKGKIYITRDNINDPGDMFGWVPGQVAYQNRYFTTEKPEDLSYDKRGPWLYTVTELPGRRYISTFDPSQVKFS
ncbi:hypothetical protein EDB80DRAFT_178781 [Ilyonectria destructans]|nr:hypothetical protein EDB80DRAFT_178781 [Ilyonectria destructans]